MDHIKLVDVTNVNSRICLDIRYATTNNIVRKAVYSMAKAFLQEEAAAALSLVQHDLETEGCGLKIWDAYRPLGVQHLLWACMPDERYVANPETGSFHNRGLAVDVTLVDADGFDLKMPTDFDDFTERAHLSYTQLDEDVLAHRELLRLAMTRRGFNSLETEWWHYTFTSSEQYPLLTIPFEHLIL